ncbi:hypothetical protein OsJ_26213 [Oryza sativa Japonica Group]|uniref:HAT C-terminal dimerisation domain-containing protein n=1 Tax=Oryza sativa subsp. japonica TaxID=39947 RepID=A3BQ39_ORYSJ|nr:hypothetical protein OsJ_26213 [Oryza sativa Japonica Group]
MAFRHWRLVCYCYPCCCLLARDERFKNVKNLVELSTMLVATKKHTAYEFVYKLLKLVLILPVATASVERVFSSMNYVKNKLRNRMGEQYLNVV